MPWIAGLIDLAFIEIKFNELTRNLQRVNFFRWLKRQLDFFESVELYEIP